MTKYTKLLAARVKDKCNKLCTDATCCGCRAWARERAGQPPLMDRTRAAVGFLNSNRRQDAGTELIAFMELFHPDCDKDKVRELANDARDRQRRLP